MAMERLCIFQKAMEIVSRLIAKSFLILLFLVVFAGNGFEKHGFNQAVAEPVVSSVRVGQHPEYTRFVMELSNQTDFNVTMLADPYRVVIDFPELKWNIPRNFRPRMYGVMQDFRYGLFKVGTSRVVLDVKNPVEIKKTLLLSPRGNVKNWRFVMDLAKTDRQSFMAKMKPAEYPKSQTVARTVAPKAPSVQTGPVQQARIPAFAPPKKPMRKSKYTIVIDAGHGGVDPGAIGKTGTYEKHITLAFTKSLRDLLNKSGRYNVVLTRDRDIFIPLRERTAIARRNNADLFISIHADSLRNSKIRGASVYTLSETASDKEAAALAERENKADLIAGIDLSTKDDDLSFILLDMAQRDTKNQSSRFAETLVKDLARAQKVLRNPHRFAGFAVLKAPDVPAVLIELGFLSNKHDEKNLKSRKHRSKLAGAIKKSINSYFDQVEEANRY